MIVAKCDAAGNVRDFVFREFTLIDLIIERGIDAVQADIAAGLASDFSEIAHNNTARQQR